MSSLRGRVFLTFLIVIGVALTALSLTMAAVAPLSFRGTVDRALGLTIPPAGQQAAQQNPSAISTPMMAGGQAGEGRGNAAQMRGQGVGMGQQIARDLTTGFQRALATGMLLSGLAALIAAGIASWGLARRVTQPIQAIAAASHDIAAGQYSRRLQAESDSAQEITELVESFNRMAESLEQIEEARRALIADISHELKTPLASIKGYMEGLEDGVIAPGPETYRILYAEAARMDRLVNGLLELSRAEAGRMALELRDEDARDLVESVVEFLRPQFVEKQVLLHFQPQDAPLLVHADPDRVRQVMINLLGNALQYSAAGGAVTVRLEIREQMAYIRVSDTGVGLAPEDLERVFLRFYRVDKSRSRAGGGSGIGLTISRRIAELHGGRLWAESPGPGKGSSFSFTLPLAG